MCAAVAVLTGLSAPSLRAEQASSSAPPEGYGSYLDACSICHGAFGRGDGSMANMLEKAPADLTQLSKNNGGVFPWRYVYETIDGRLMSDAHGQRDMPIWGEVWTRAVPPEQRKHADVYVKGRVLELMLYLDAIQQK
jgi:mono/diheme cytochrome c family protein